MVDGIMAIVDFFVSIVQLVINTVQSIVWVITSIPQYQASITAVFAYCPSFLLVFLEISLALMVLFAIIKLL